MLRLFSSAAYRIALVYSVAFTLLMVLLGTVLYFAFHAALIHQLDSGIINEMTELTVDYRHRGLAGLTGAIAQRVRASTTHDLGYALFDKAGKRIAGHLNTPLPPLGARNIVFIDPREGPDPARARVRRLDNGMTLVIAADQGPVEEINDTMLSLLFGALIAVVVVGLAGGLVLGGYLQKRLGRISAAAQGIMAGDLSQRITTSPRNDEFDQLAVTLNHMLDRIGALMENLQQVSSDIAHDMRTPLSRLRSRLERARADAGRRRDTSAAIDDSLAAVDELLAMFSAILRISEVESGEPKRAFRWFDLSALVQEICQSYAPAIEDNGRVMQWQVAADIHLAGDRELLAQAIINLVENAQKHTLPGTRISVSLERTGDIVAVSVADNGPGVSDEDRDRITGRFIRLEQARSTPGNGLGLNLVAAIVALHDGDLAFEDNDPGLRAIISLPASDRAE